MKKLLLLVGVASLAACGSGAEGEAEADSAVATEEAAPAEADAAASAEAPSIPNGQFTMTVEGTEMGIATFREDGYFAQEEPDEMTLEGRWEVAEDGKLCVTIDDSDSDPVCFGVGETNEDGSWTLTAPNGEVGTLVPVAEG